MGADALEEVATETRGAALPQRPSNAAGGVFTAVPDVTSAALPPGRSAAVLALQRGAGNRAVSAIIARPAPRTLARCAGPCTCGGECSERGVARELRGACSRPDRPAERPVGARSSGSPRDRGGTAARPNAPSAA